MTDLTDVRRTIPEFSGTELARGDDGYDQARRVFNGMIDRSPALIATCRSAADVAAAIAYARAGELPISVYGGGHSVNGSAVVDGGLCVDLRGLRDAVVDPAASTAQVGGGCTWGELDAATGHEILELFRRLNGDGTTLVVVTHDDHLAAEAGRIIHMLDGTIRD